MVTLSAMLGAPAHAQARKDATVLMSESERGRQSQAELGYNDAIIVGDTIYLSGIVVGMAPGESEMKLGFDRVYQRIGGILKRAGASWDDVVDMTSFHTDVEGQINDMAAVHKRYVTAPFPAWTAIGVARILGGGITEIKITAKRRSGAAAGETGK
jgi:enamine deaminase RidA (YjgF/YER057c/UK114 family)